MILIFLVPFLNAIAQNIFVLEEMNKIHDEEYKKIWEPTNFNNMIHCLYKRYETDYKNGLTFSNDLKDIQNTFLETDKTEFHFIFAEFKLRKKDFENNNFGLLPLTFIKQVYDMNNKRTENIYKSENLTIKYNYFEKNNFDHSFLKIKKMFFESFLKNTDENYVILRISYFFTDLINGFFPKFLNLPLIEKRNGGKTNPIYFMFSLRFNNPIRFLFPIKYINENKMNFLKTIWALDL